MVDRKQLFGLFLIECSNEKFFVQHTRHLLKYVNECSLFVRFIYFYIVHTKMLIGKGV